MATIASLVTQLVMRTEPFSRALTAAEGRYAKFERSLVGKTVGAAAAIGGLSKALNAIGDSINEANAGENWFNSLRENTAEAVKSIPIIGGLTKIFVGLRDALTGDAAELQAWGKRLKEVEGRSEKAEAKLKRLQPVIGALTKLDDEVRFFGESSNIAMALAARATDKAIAKIRELELALIKLKDAEKNDEILADLDQKVRSWGMSADEVVRYEAALRGATAAQLAHMEAMQITLAAAELQKDVAELTDRLQLQADTFGMSARQAEIYALAQRGATDEILAQARALDELLTRLEHQKKLMDDGRAVWERTRTAAERYAIEIAKLKELLESGAIDEDTYRRAVEQAQEALDRANESADRANKVGRGMDEFQSPAAIERRFGEGMPSGLATSPDKPLLELNKRTDLLVFDGKVRTNYTREMRDGIRELVSLTPQFTIVTGVN